MAVYIVTPMVLISLVAGILGLAVSLAMRRNTARARSLRKSSGLADERFVLLLLPGISMFLLGAGILGLVLPGIGGAFSVPIGVLLAAPGVVLIGFGIFLAGAGLGSGPAPTWAKPRGD